MFLGLGIHEQNTVLACLLDHAYVDIVPLLALLLGLGVLVHHAGKERSLAVRVLGDEVETHADRNPDCTPEKALLFN